MTDLNEYTGPTEDAAKEQAAIVLNNLVNLLSAHFNLMKSQSRAIVRAALMEL